jgi:hypothetical protein
MIAEPLAAEFSAVIAGLRPPEKAMARAAAEIRLIEGEAP